MPALTTTDDGFLLHGRPLRIMSGSLHYPRVHPEQWADRLHKARLMGLNTIETYVPWNLHQPEPGTLVLEGGSDLPRFLDLAHEQGLHVLLRPGPYICAEWDAGGLPAWLLNNDGMRVRSSDPRFTAAVDDYFARLLPRLLPYMASNGGPVIAVQIENEYGAFGDDPEYLAHLAETVRGQGVQELLFTCDQADDAHQAAGGLPGVLRTGNFGSRVGDALATLRRAQPTGPLMCAEFWIGWFDSWGGPHHVRDPEDAASELGALLEAGASFNIYLFHGGTNFGFTNGAMHEDGYAPTTTSYDYGAPLDEAGDPTPMYTAFRRVIADYAQMPGEQPGPAPKLAHADIPLRRSVGLLECAPLLSAPVRSEDPVAMERLGQSSGFVLYRGRLPTAEEGRLELDAFADRVQVLVDGVPAGVLERGGAEDGIVLRPRRAGAVLDLLVENQGRINYGPRVLDSKGIWGPVRFGGRRIAGWDCHPLALQDPGAVIQGPEDRTSTDAAPAGPAFYQGGVILDEPADTFLALPGWTKGQAWVNGVDLGRYWTRGPQQTLYVPAPVLHSGRNEITVLELHGTDAPVVHFRAAHDLGAGRD